MMAVRAQVTGGDGRRPASRSTGASTHHRRPFPWAAHHAEVAMPGVSCCSSTASSSRGAGTRWRGRAVPAATFWVQLPSREAVDVCTPTCGRRLFRTAPPYYTFWGARYAWSGSDGKLPSGLMRPIDPARQSAPPTL